MDFLRRQLKKFDGLEPLTVRLLKGGLRLACALAAAATVLQLLIGRVGNFLSMIIYAHGAYSAAVGVMVATLIACLLGEIYVREHRQA